MDQYFAKKSSNKIDKIINFFFQQTSLLSKSCFSIQNGTSKLTIKKKINNFRNISDL